MRTSMLAIAAVLALTMLVMWAGLRTQPTPFPVQARNDGLLLEPIRLSDDLPEPVARFYRTVLDGNAPDAKTAVISGRATLNVFGMPFPARFRFTHLVGESYVHDIEATLFGLTVMRVHETYVNGEARLELPFGVIADSRRIDSAANLALWAEGIWMPWVWLRAPDVRWSPIDAASAWLVVPSAGGRDSLHVRFDPKTGLIASMQADRFRDPEDVEKKPWLTEMVSWRSHNGIFVPEKATITWLDQDAPWARFHVEAVVYGSMTPN